MVSRAYFDSVRSCFDGVPIMSGSVVIVLAKCRLFLDVVILGWYPGYVIRVSKEKIC